MSEINDGKTIMTIDDYLSQSEEEIERQEKEYEEILKKAQTKKADDCCFDELFNEAVTYIKYEAEFDTIALFECLQQEYDILYKCFQYTKRFVRSINKDAMMFYEKQLHCCLKTGEQIAESEEYYGDRIISFNFFIKNNCEAYLLMVYRFFEQYLKEIVAFLDEEASELKTAKDDFIVVEYMKFLKRKNVFVPNELFFEYDKFRLIRNHIVHSNERITKKLLKYLKKDTFGLRKNDNIVLNEQYVEYVFEVIGRIFKSIELAIAREL